jgi:hypothetical protein
MPVIDKALVVAATAAAVFASAPAATAEPEIRPDQLAGLQPRPEEVAPIVKWPIDPMPALNVDGTWRAPFVDPANISDPACLGAVVAGVKSAYQGSGYVAMDIQHLVGVTERNWYSVISVAANYPSPDSARDFLEKQTNIWTGCREHVVSFRTNDQDETWEIHMPTAADDTVFVVTYQTDTAPACSHALAVRANVVVEVNACRTAVGLIEQGLAIANLMLDKVPA